MNDNNDDELIHFADDGDQSEWTVESETPWRILLVDDDPQVHEATRFALEDQLILGYPVELHKAESGNEARQMLETENEYACILLDVVMESEDAGLALVSFIRENLSNRRTRIILRTGQPGHAPELEVIEQYDINDYKAKNELTQNRLITTLTAALRSYQQTCTIDESREGLELIINGAFDFFRNRGAEEIARGVLMQLCTLLQIEEDGFICCRYSSRPEEDLRLVAGSGHYETYVGASVKNLKDVSLQQQIERVYCNKESVINTHRVTLYMVSPHGDELVAHATSRGNLQPIDLRLLELFSINVALGFDNALMFEEMERLAFVDQLTGLPNRTALLRDLDKEIEKKHPFALAFANLDNFQSVTDGLGRALGDKALLRISGWLRDKFGDQALVSRVGGDSFCWIIHDTENAADRLERCHQDLAQGFQIDGHDLALGFTVGVASFPEHGKDAEALLQDASIALKRAKETQKSTYCFFDTRFEQELRDRLTVAQDLRFAVERRQLEIHCQPQINLEDKRITGAEALLRWRRDDLSLVPPGEFIPVAEDSGHIVHIGAWIMEEACRACGEWTHVMGRPLSVAVNVSMRQLWDCDFLNVLDDVLARTCIDPGQLELEVTESMMMADTRLMAARLEAVRQRGVKVAIDDFGTGYSSLSYLQKLPVDRLKIDRSFVEGLHEYSENQVIASLIVEMGHSLNLRVLAEGVETRDQENHLRRFECDDVQGFYYARPLPQKDLLHHIQSMGR